MGWWDKVAETFKRERTIKVTNHDRGHVCKCIDVGYLKMPDTGELHKDIGF